MRSFPMIATPRWQLVLPHNYWVFLRRSSGGDEPAPRQRICLRFTNREARLFAKQRCERRDETTRREKRHIRIRDDGNQRGKMLHCTIPYPSSSFIASRSQFEYQRRECGQAVRTEIPHPARAQRLNAANRPKSLAAERIFRHNTVYCGEAMS